MTFKVTKLGKNLPGAKKWPKQQKRFCPARPSLPQLHGKSTLRKARTYTIKGIKGFRLEPQIQSHFCLGVSFEKISDHWIALILSQLTSNYFTNQWILKKRWRKVHFRHIFQGIHIKITYQHDLKRWWPHLPYRPGETPPQRNVLQSRGRSLLRTSACQKGVSAKQLNLFVQNSGCQLFCIL